MADMKTAAYICSGCGIGERSNVAQMTKVAHKEGKMALVREHAFLCSAEGVQMIRDDIDKEGVTHIAIAACSRRAKIEAFNFPDVAMSRANLREGVIWAGPEGDEHEKTTPGDGGRLRAHGLRRNEEDEGAGAPTRKPATTSASWWWAAASPA